MGLLRDTEHTNRTRCLVLMTYIACLSAFIVDITSTDTLAFGVLYIPFVATALCYRDKRAVWVLAACACAMVIIGTFIPSIDPDTVDLAFNRAASIVVVLGTAVLVHHVRSIQDRLSEYRRFAEPTEATE